MKKILFLCLMMLAFTARSQEDYTGFYAKREASLKSENGWLNLAGLFWLKEGENTIGGAESNDFVFPHAEASLGKVILQNNQVNLVRLKVYNRLKRTKQTYKSQYFPSTVYRFRYGNNNTTEILMY